MLDEKDLEIKRLDQYYDHRKYLLACQHSLADSFDKYVMAMGAGLLGLSATFLRVIAPSISPGSHGWIISCWICTSISLFATLLSLQTAQDDFDEGVEEIDESIVEFNKADCDQEVASGDNEISVENVQLTGGLNWLSFFLLAVGFVCFAVFSYSNLEKSENGKEEKSSQTREETSQGGQKEASEEEEKGSEEDSKAEGQEEGREEENGKTKNEAVGQS